MSLIPAYLLYWALPEDAQDAQAGGTLKGIRFKLGGSFAGYFVLVLTIFVMLPPPIPDKKQIWTLRADVTFSDGAGLIDFVRVRTNQNPRPTNSGLEFDLVGEWEDGEWSFPGIVKIGHENYETAPISLNKDENYTLDRDNKIIDLGKVTLEREPQ